MIEDEKLKSLKEGDLFGEIAVLTHLERTTTIKTKEYCTLAYIEKPVF